MSRGALSDELRRKAAEDAEAVWRDARAAAEACRLTSARRVEERRTALATELGAARRRLEEAAGAEAARRSREILAAATRTLADRLQVIARAALERLRQDAADGLFEALAAELPPRQWQLVRVNPADEQRARVLFPQAEIVGDAGISGGMTVEAEGGRIRVSNTLETRLDAAWPDVVPGLVAGILAENSDDRAAA